MTGVLDDGVATLDELRDALAIHPEDRVLRLRLGQRLAACHERAQARLVLEPLEEPAAHLHLDDAISKEAALLLARLDTEEGAHQDAIRRWEIVLAYDIDHPEASAALQRLRASRLPLPSHAAEVLPGATLVSPQGISTTRYTLVHELGRGATSTVYLARDRQLDLPVALKVLHPTFGATARAQSREQFFWEARAAARLRHPGVVAIYDLDERARTLTMEYLPAGTLRARINQAHKGASSRAGAEGNEDDPGTLAADEILETIIHLLAALHCVHTNGLVHGDLKPRNVLLRRPGVPVLCDFGVARLLAHDPRNADGPAGTPLFLAPEQLRGAPASVATDLFAVGAILWEMATGHLMRTREELTQGRLDEKPLPPSAEARLAKDAHTARLIHLCRALTKLDPGARPASAATALRLLD